MATKVELLEHLRKLSGMPPLNEEELSTLDKDENEENEEVLAEAKAKGKKNEQDDDEKEKKDSDSEEDAEDEEDDEDKKKPAFLKKEGKSKKNEDDDDDDEDSEDDEEDDDDDDEKKPAFLKGEKKNENKKKVKEALTPTKKKASAGAGADAKVVHADPGLDPEAVKHAPAADAGEEEVVEADAVQATTADKGIPTKPELGQKGDPKNITPEKKKGAKAAGVDLKVLETERKKNEIIPETMMARIVTEAMDNAEGDEEQKLNEVAPRATKNKS
jgi:hypothetical protein